MSFAKNIEDFLVYTDLLLGYVCYPFPFKDSLFHCFFDLFYLASYWFSAFFIKNCSNSIKNTKAYSCVKTPSGL